MENISQMAKLRRKYKWLTLLWYTV